MSLKQKLLSVIYEECTLTTEQQVRVSKEIDQLVEAVLPKTKTIAYTFAEGGIWNYMKVHSLVMPDGHRWDAVSGWEKGPDPELKEMLYAHS